MTNIELCLWGFNVFAGLKLLVTPFEVRAKNHRPQNLQDDTNKICQLYVIIMIFWYVLMQQTTS